MARNVLIAAGLVAALGVSTIALAQQPPAVTPMTPEMNPTYSFTRPEAFYWGQERRDDSAIFEVRWIGEFSLDVKRTITRIVSTEIAPAVGLDPDRVRVLFTTFTTADWGRSRGDYS